MSIKEKVAYLMGLAEGLGLDSESKEGKLISVIIDTLADMADELDVLAETTEEMIDEIDAISEDLADVEDFLMEEDEDDDDVYDFGGLNDLYDDEDDFDCDCDCCCDDEDEFSYTADCPNCAGEVVLTEEDLVNGWAMCATCGEKLEIEFGDDDEEDDEAE